MKTERVRLLAAIVVDGNVRGPGSIVEVETDLAASLIARRMGEAADIERAPAPVPAPTRRWSWTWRWALPGKPEAQIQPQARRTTNRRPKRWAELRKSRTMARDSEAMAAFEAELRQSMGAKPRF